MSRTLTRLAGLLGAVGVLLGGCAPAERSAGPAPTAAAAAVAPATAAPRAASPPPAVPVRITTARTASDAGIFVATERGYFEQEGLAAELVGFASTSEMIPAVATGQVETATIGPNPAMLNALARGVPVRAVLDLGSFRPGVGYQSIVIRKDLYDRGEGHGLADLRGLSVAITPPGKATTSACALSAGIERVGLTLDDINIVPLPFPDMVPAFANGAIDAALMSEPFMTRASRQGTIVRTVPTAEMYPNFALGILSFAQDFYANRPVAKAFARGYIRAVRDLLDARAGRTSEAHRAELEEIIARNTGLDAATVHEMALPGFNPNGLPSQEGMVYCYQFFRDLGLVPEIPAATLAGLWGTDLVEEVLGEIGRVPKS
jgi:NitT/TauT family transport system substrate-binding protein